MSDPFSDVVVVVPGIGGSVLTRNDKEVWAPRPGAALRAIFSRGSSIKDLKLNGDDPAAPVLDDGVKATKLVDDLHIVPGLDWKIDGYTHLRKELTGKLELTPGKNYFELPYDWRRDNRAAAAKLQTNADAWLRAWQNDGHPGAKLVLIGHSMGGMVARIYLELMGGWRNTRSLVTFGTPYSGSVKALEFLANGFKKGWGPATVDLTETLRSLTAAYQLLPSYRCLNTGGDPAFIDPTQPIPGFGASEVTMMTEALTLHTSIRKKVDENRSHNYGGTGGYDIRPVISDVQNTDTAAMITSGKIETSRVRGGTSEGGDGTVPKVSASPHEYIAEWKNATFVTEKHASLQNDKAVIAHVCGVLRALQPSDVPVFPLDDVPVAVDVEDVLIGEAVTITAQPANAGLDVGLVVERIADGTKKGVALAPDPALPGRMIATIDDWKSGDYRVMVDGPGIQPTTDFFSIVDPAEDPEG